MVFTSTAFLFAFLPVAVLTYYVFPASLRAVPLLVLSCLFYGWGEPVLVVLIMASSLLNFVWGRLLQRPRLRHPRLLLAVGIAFNLVPLAAFKYLGFVLRSIGLDDVATRTALPLPIGVSFYTFMAISYLIDIHRRRNTGAPSLLMFGAYLTMFPHLVAGPIVRWGQVGHQLLRPRFDAGMFGYGALRISVGLAKKAVLADSLSPVVDTMFATGAPTSVGAAWTAAALYSLQIYLDFSAYSDIAIGLAYLLGVRFEENFRYPYLSRSAREFWQRWHISLGSWFRDYVYIPLGGSRVRPLLIWRNLLIVWGLTGLWHGAAWTFIFWGLYYGVLIGLERSGLGAAVERLPVPMQHLYGLLVAVLGWVLFRAVDLGQALAYYRTMFGLGGVPLWDSQAAFAVAQSGIVVLVAVLVSAGIGRRAMDAAQRGLAPAPDAARPVVENGAGIRAVEPAPAPRPESTAGNAAAVLVVDRPVASEQDEQDPVRPPRTFATSLGVAVAVTVLLLVATSFLVSVSYQPFIYFRF